MNKDGSTEMCEQNAIGKRFGTKTVGTAAVVVFIAAYSFAQPLLNERLGWDLPSLQHDSGGQVAAGADSRNDHAQATPATRTVATAQTTESAKKSPKSKENPKAKTPAASATKKQTKPGESGVKRGPLADRLRASKRDQSKSPRGPPQTPQADDDLVHGLLREVGRDRYMSPAGLLYGPGSAEGHRLEHLRRHTKDIPARPAHGVFDGEMEGALKTIDQAYEKAKKGVRTTKKVDQSRTIYTVDMGKRIGYLGGKAGARKRNPMARRVRLVLEGKQVITAYPTD